MSSYPLAALTVHPPEQPDVMGQAGKFMQLKALMNQEQLAPLRRQQMEQEVQSGQQEMQQRNMQLQQQQQMMQDANTIRQGMAQNPNATYGELRTNLRGKIGPAADKQLLDLDKEQTDYYANLDEKRLKNRQTRDALGQNLLDNALNTPDQQYQAQWPNFVQQAKSIPGYENLQLDPSQPLTKQQLSQFGPFLAMGENYRKGELAKRSTQADLTIKESEAAATQGGGVNPKIPMETQEANSWLKLNPGKTLTDYQKYKATLVPAFNFNLQAKGVDGGNGTPPSGDYKQQIASFGPKGGVIKAIIEGRQDPPASFAQKSPYWQDVMQKVYSVDPDFNQQRAQLRKEFTVGKTSHEINAINTAMGHVGVLGDAIDALNNGDVRVLNSIANRFGIETGKDAVTTYNTIVHRVGPEISSAYLAAGGTAGERGSNEDDFKADKGTAQLKNNVSITSKLLRSKISSLEKQWDQNKAPSMPTFGDQFITKEAKQQLDKWSPQQGGGSEFSVKAPNGHTYIFKDQQSLDTFKKTAGLQ